MAENWDPNIVSRVMLIDPTDGSRYAATGVGNFSGAVFASAGDMVDEAAIRASLAAKSVLNITDTADHNPKNGAGTLAAVFLNTAAATSTLKVYDGLTAGGTLLATLDGTGATGNAWLFNVALSTGLFAKATGTADWSVTFA